MTIDELVSTISDRLAIRAATDDESVEHAWRDPPGIIGFLTTVDHKRLGLRYVYTAFVFFFVAGSEALIMRTQLSHPTSNLVGAQAYNQLFTMHGTTMIFLFNTPVLAGFAQLPPPAAARHPRPRVPAAQRLQLLGLPVRRASSCTSATSRAPRPTAAGSPTCR